MDSEGVIVLYGNVIEYLWFAPEELVQHIRMDCKRKGIRNLYDILNRILDEHSQKTTQDV